MTAPGPTDQAEELAAAHTTARQRAEAGDLTGARTLIEDALTAGEVRLGRDDPRLVPLMVDLATLARKLGNLTEARNQLRRAYAIIVATAGPEHATSLSIEGRLAAVIYRLGEPTEAYDWHLADAGRRVLGTDHPAVRGAQQRLAASAQGTAPVSAPPPVPVIGWAEPDPSEDPVDDQGWAPPPETYTPVAPGVYELHQRAPRPRQSHGQAHSHGQGEEPEVWQEPPLSAGDLTVRRRGHGGGVALVVSLGLIILVAAVVIAVQFFKPISESLPSTPRPTGGSTVQAAVPPTPAPTPTAPAPTNVLIKDEGGSVTLTWDDPGAGRVPFIVSGGRDGTVMTALDTVPAGRTTSTIYGLNEGFNYCFTVSAVWGSDKITPSIRTCTSRLSITSTP